MKRWATPAALGIALALAACQSMTPQKQIARLAGTSWHAESIRGAAVATDVESTLEIDEQAQVAGVGGCNAYVSDISIESDTIRFSEPSTANVPCGPSQTDQEERFFAALLAVRRSRIERARLLLLDERNDPVVTFRPGRLSIKIR